MDENGLPEKKKDTELSEDSSDASQENYMEKVKQKFDQMVVIEEASLTQEKTFDKERKTSQTEEKKKDQGIIGTIILQQPTHTEESEIVEKLMSEPSLEIRLNIESEEENK